MELEKKWNNKIEKWGEHNIKGEGMGGSNSLENQLITEVARRIGVDREKLSKEVHLFKQKHFSGKNLLTTQIESLAYDIIDLEEGHRNI